MIGVVMDSPRGTTHRRQYDLPPMWDDLLVTWEGWETSPHVFVCPPPKDMGCCRKCGSLAPPVKNRGLVATSPTTTREDLDYDAENRRRLGSLAWKRPRLDFARLYAARCPDCRHDVVTDLETGETWDLDDTDYGEQGSIDPAEVQGALF